MKSASTKAMVGSVKKYVLTKRPGMERLAGSARRVHHQHDEQHLEQLV